MTELLWIGLGLGALLAGSEGVVRGGRVLASRVGVSELAVGLVVASVGTSLPELFTVIQAARASMAGGADADAAAAIGVGNVIGSNLFLLLFLLGLVGIFRTLPVDRKVWQRDGLAVAASTAALLVFGIDGQVGSWEGMILLFGFGAWLVRVGIEEREAPGEATGPSDGEGASEQSWPWWVDGVRIAAGLGLLAIGSDLVVGQGTALAEKLRIGATLIGVLAGVGTSLPEIGVSLRAGQDGSADLSLGNLLGSALTNALLCTGAGALLGDLTVPVEARMLELPFLVAGTIAALALTWERRELTRAEGIVLVTLFGLYLTLRIIG